MKIISPTNPKIKRLVKLKQRKRRDYAGLTLVDGLREIRRAQEAGITIRELYICPPLLEKFSSRSVVDEVYSWGVDVCEVSAAVFQKISFGDRHEGVAATVATKTFKLDATRLPQNPLIVVLENVEKPGNLGAILRTCDGAGVDALIVADETTDILNPNVIRASTGVVFSINVMQASAHQVKDFLTQHGISIVAATPKGSQDYFVQDFRQPTAFILGAEDKGLSDFWLQASDVQVVIPMTGKADSLNVSTTAAILVYEALRQRNK